MDVLEAKLNELLQKYDEKNEDVLERPSLTNDLKSLLDASDVAKQGIHALRKQRLNAEHQLSQLEKQLISCNSKLGKETTELSRIKKQLEERGNSLEEKQEIIRNLDNEKTEISTKYNKVTKSNSELEDEKASLLEVLEKKSKEIERLNEEWKTMSENLSEANKVKYEAQSNLDEIKSGDITREFKLKRMEQEKDLLASQNAHLSAELNAKTEELAKIKKSKTSEVLDLQTECDQQKKEIKILNSSLEGLQTKSEEQEEKINKLIDKLKQAREEMADTESHMEKELAAKTKLVDLYKESSEDSKRKVDEMTVAVEEMKKMFNETEEKNGQLESKLELSETDRKAEVRELDEKIKQLCDELDNANELLEVARKKAPSLSKESLESLSPSAVAASALIKKGMTLTQIYSEYVTVSDALELQKDENTKLKQYLDQILQEIEEKAPVLQQQKEDYELSLKTIENLTVKFGSAMTECERYRTEQEEATRKCDFTRRENDRLNVLCADLGQQIRVLVKEVEEARGGIVSTDNEMPSIVSSDKVSSSSQIISEHLVSFRNIEELQEQNQKLLAVVRDLSEEREKQEKDCSPEKMKELESKLDFAFEQVNQLKEEREKQENIIHTLVKQRDMYKVLYNAEERPEVSSSSFMQQSMQISSAETESELQKTKAYLNKITEDYEKYKKEHKAKETSLQEKIEKIEEAVSTLRTENQHLKGKLEFLEEKNSIQQKTNEGLKREADALTEKSRGLETALSKSQKEAVFYKQELELANEKRISSEVEVKTLTTEKRLIKETEQRLMQENKTLIEQQRSRNVLLTNLQTIQNNLERQEFTTRKTLGNQIENMQLELKSLRRKVDTEEHEKKSSIGSLNEQIKQLNSQLEGERKLRKETDETINEVNKKLETSNQKCSELQQQLDASESRLNALVNQDDPKNVQSIEELRKDYEEKCKTLQAKISEGESRIKALQSQVQSATKHIEQYKQISSSSEEALKDATQKYSLLQKESNKKIEMSSKRINELNRQLEAAKVEIESRKSKAEKVERDLQFTIDETKGSLSVLDSEYIVMKNNMKSFKEQAELAKKEAKEHALTAQEKQEKYERELVLHAKDVEELVKLKEKLHGYVTEIDNSVAKIREAQEKMLAAEKSMENMKLHHAEESKKLADHSKEISEQNTLLHKEIEKLSEQIASEKKQKIADISKLSEEAPKSADQSTEDLYEVLRFMRREKEIAETKCEAAQSESIRYRQRCEHHEKELEETQDALQLERRRTQGQMLTTEEHADLISKVSQVAELAEVKKELEKQKNELDKTNKALKAKVLKLENEVEPLRQSKKLMEEEKGSLVAERAALKSEIQRWTTRTQQLIEQNNKANSDSEQLKQLQQSKSQNDKIVGALRDEISRLKVQKEAINKEKLKMKKDATEHQGKVTLLSTLADTIKSEKEEAAKKFNEEIENLKKETKDKEADISEKLKLIGRLKSLARKYKSQCEELQKTQGTNEPKTDAPTTEDSSKKSISDEERKQFQEEMEKLQGDLKNAETKINELNTKLKEASKKDEQLTNDVECLKTEVEKLNKENVTAKATLADRDEKDERNKKILRSAKEKINDLNAQKDKLSNESKDLKKMLKEQEELRQLSDDSLKEKEMRFNILKNQFDTSMEKVEKDLNELRDENKELNDRLQGLEEEKRLANENSEELTKAITESEEKIAKLKAHVSLKPMQDHNAPEAAVFAPLTATVRPTSAAVTSQTQKSMSTRTASIKPLIPTVTPTAMVSPTVPPVHSSATQVVNPIVTTSNIDATTEPRIQVPDVVPGQSRGQASVFKTPRVVATVQGQEGIAASESQATVAPIVASEAASSEQEEGEEAESSAATTTTAEPLDADTIEILRTPGLSDSHEETEERLQSEERLQEQSENPPDITAATTEEHAPEFVPLETQQAKVSRVTQVANEAQNQESNSTKRRRSVDSKSESEEDEGNEDGPEEKRQRIQEEGLQFEEREAEDEVISISDGEAEARYDEDDDEEEEEEEYEEEEEEEEVGDEEEMEENVEEEGVDSEASVEEIEDDVDDDEESLVFEEPAFDDEVTEEGEMEVADGSEDGEEMEDQEEGVENIEEDVIDNTEVSEPSMSSAQSVRDTLTVPSRDPVRELQRRQPSPAAFMLAAQEQGGRGRVFRRRYQLPSFSLPPGQGGSGPFDDAEDCTVPSTPTLYEPKRSDGFAEAVSSPQVRHPVFSFPGGAEGVRAGQVSGLGADVTDEGLRLDDTRVDLLAGEESGSVPMTPIGIVPSVTITPVSRSDDGDEMVVTRQNLVPGRLRQSSTACVPQMSTEYNSQEQNVPQQIDLTADDEEDEEDDVEDEVDDDNDDDDDDDGEQEVLSTDLQEDDIFEDSNQPAETNEEVRVEEQQDEKETEIQKEEQVEIEAGSSETQETQESKFEKEDEPAPEITQEAPAPSTVVTRATASSAPRTSNRRPRLRRKVMAGRAASSAKQSDEKPET